MSPPDAAGWVGLSPVAVWQSHLSGRLNPLNRKGLWHATHTATHPQKVAVWQPAPRHGPLRLARVRANADSAENGRDRRKPKDCRPASLKLATGPRGLPLQALAPLEVYAEHLLVASENVVAG